MFPRFNDTEANIMVRKLVYAVPPATAPAPMATPAALPTRQRAESPRSPESYAEPFTTFLTENPTIFHTVDYFTKKLTDAGYSKVLPLLSEWAAVC